MAPKEVQPVFDVFNGCHYLPRETLTGRFGAVGVILPQNIRAAGFGHKQPAPARRRVAKMRMA